MSASLLSIIPGLALLVTGFTMTFYPDRHRVDRTAEFQRRLDDRMARGTDSYFEELRTIQAYSKPSPIKTIRRFGILFLLLGLVGLGLNLSR